MTSSRLSPKRKHRANDRFLTRRALRTAPLRDLSGDARRRRLRALQKGGLVEYYDEDRGLYRVTDRGQAYLKGSLNAGDFEQ